MRAQKHGYDFVDAPQVIECGQSVTFEDRRFDYDEPRFISLGVLREEVVVITTAETDEEIRHPPPVRGSFLLINEVANMPMQNRAGRFSA